MTSTDVSQEHSEDRAIDRPREPILLGRLVAKLACDSRKAHRIGLVLLVILCLELSAAILATGCPTLNSMPWDLATLLDGGYRVLNGQKPHVDFYSPLGLVTLALVAVGMKIGSPTASAIAYTHAILLPVLALWAWILLRTRAPAFFAGFLALWVGVLAVTPRSLGWPPPLASYSMQYNRWGWALLLIAAIELFLPRRDGKDRGIAGISTGLITGLLLFLKINYFAVAVAAIAVRLACRGLDWKWLVRTAGAFTLVAAAGFWYLNFNFAAFIGDLRLLASVQSLSSRLGYLVQLIFANAPELGLLGFTMLLSGIWLYPRDGSWQARARWLAVPGSLAGLGLVNCCANFQKFEIPLIAFAVFVVAEHLRRGLAGPDAGPLVSYLAVCLAAAGIIGQGLYQDLGTLAAARSGPSEAEIQQHWPGFDAAPLRDLRVSPPVNIVSAESVRNALEAQAITWREEEGEAYPYPMWFNDGIQLLKAHVGAHSHVLVMDLSNPFSFALGLTPPRGDALFWHYGRDFNFDHFPPAERVFREVTHIMVPKAPVHRSATYALQKIYAHVLTEKFYRAAESDLWILYQSRASAPLNH